MILKLVSYKDTTKLDAPDASTLAKQLRTPEESIKTETIEFERTDASVYLYLLGKLNLVFFYDLYESPSSVVYVCSSQREAFKVFREQTLIGCVNEYISDKEEGKIEKILEKYGLLDDLKIVFEIIQKLGGEANLDKILKFARSEGLSLGCGYPSVVMTVDLTDEEMQREYLEILAGILEKRGYLEIADEEGLSWRIVKQMNF